MGHRDCPDDVPVGEELRVGVGAARVRRQDPVGEVLLVVQRHVRLPQNGGGHSGNKYYKSRKLIS